MTYVVIMYFITTLIEGDVIITSTNAVKEKVDLSPK